jgi:hypothetical protein
LNLRGSLFSDFYVERVFAMKCSHFFQLVLACMAVLVATAGQVQAAVFENFKGTNAFGYSEETRSADLTFGTVLNSTTTTTINQMEFRWRPNVDMDVTFYIWHSSLGGSFGSVDWTPIGNNVLFSQTKSFSAVAGPVDYYLVTDPFSFTFLPNHRYDIGIQGSTGDLTGSWDFKGGFFDINTIEGGFESINLNANIFGGQSDVGYAGVDPHVRLSTVPEPTSLAVFGIGACFAGVGATRRRRREKHHQATA